MKNFLYFFMPSVFFLIDQLAKLWVRNNFYPGQTKTVLPFMDFTYVTNTGTAFGLAAGNNLFFILLSAAVIVFLIICRKNIFNPGKLSFLSYSMILGGAFGNLLDRVVFGRVTDFLDFRFWPVFNLADACISVGIGVYLLDAYIIRRKDAPDPAGS